MAADSRAAEAKGGARVAAVGEQATTVSISRTGRLVYARETHDSNLWELRLSASGEAEAPPVRILSSTLDEHTPDYSPDGKRIAFTSTRSGNEEIWMANADGSHPVQLTNMGGPSTVNPRWSPDGRKILFTSRPEGSSDLYVLDPSTGSWRRFTSHPANDVEPRWSRNGRWIYFGSNRTGRYEVWKMPAQGGAPVQLTKQGGLAAYESADGRWVYYSKSGRSPDAIWKVAASGGEETPVTGGLSYSLNFVVADKGLYFMAERGAPDKTSIDFFDFGTAKVRTLLKVGKRWWYGMALAPDQRSLLYSVVDSADSNLMLVENFR